MESASVSASSISSYINVNCTISLITVSPPHWLYPLVQGEGHYSPSPLFIVSLPPLMLPLLSSLPFPPCASSLYHFSSLLPPSPVSLPLVAMRHWPAPMKQVNFLPARRMNKSPWLCSERWGYLSKWSVSSSAQRHRLLI